MSVRIELPERSGTSRLHSGAGTQIIDEETGVALKGVISATLGPIEANSIVTATIVVAVSAINMRWGTQTCYVVSHPVTGERVDITPVLYPELEQRSAPADTSRAISMLTSSEVRDGRTWSQARGVPKGYVITEDDVGARLDILVPVPSAEEAASRPSQAELQALWDLCRGWTDRLRVTCPEATVNDRVYEHAPELVEQVCGVVGYYSDPDDADDE